MLRRWLRRMRTDKKIVLGLLLGVAAAFALMQLWPLNRDNPAIVSEPEWDSTQTRQLAERACFDCHSNETHWPWYTAIIPVGNLIVSDVERGRAVLNFSDWEQTCCTLEQIDDTATIINTGDMPLPYYIILHPEARLSTVERGQLVNGLIATMNTNLGE